MKNKKHRTSLKPEILTMKITVPLQRVSGPILVKNEKTGKMVKVRGERLLENFDWPMPHFNGMSAKEMIAFQIIANIDRQYSQHFTKVEVK